VLIALICWALPSVGAWAFYRLCTQSRQRGFRHDLSDRLFGGPGRVLHRAGLFSGRGFSVIVAATPPSFMADDHADGIRPACGFGIYLVDVVEMSQITPAWSV